MKTFYATFGNHLINWHLVLEASNADIAHAYMMKKSGLSGCFCRITEDEPADTKSLTDKPVGLFYSHHSHI
jgi:hypothetical protein